MPSPAFASSGLTRVSGARETLVYQASVVSISGRALAIEGAPGSGKSTLALALIDRGAQLIGDDGVTLSREGSTLIASAPPNIAGLIEVHGVGIIERPVSAPAPLALILTLSDQVERLPDAARPREILGLPVPTLAFSPGSIAPALRAELALQQHGLPASA